MDSPVDVAQSTGVIDCDLHNELPGLQTLYPYLPDHWRAYAEESAFTGPDANDYPAGAPTTARPGSQPANGDPAGSDLRLMQEQVLDAWPIAVGILNCSYRVASVHNEDLAAALATALNQWQIDSWLDPEPRLRASIVVPSQNPERAAQEIERWGDHPGFVQVVLPVRSLMPYGKPHYDPIFQAADRHGLVVGIQYGGGEGHPSTPVGWPSTYLEEMAGMSQVFQSQVMSLITEGVFARFPELRVTLIEGGFTWLPSLMWRLDKEWKGLRHNTPWVKRAPSAYMREHMRLTVQPLDAPPDKAHLLQIVEQIESDEMLLFSTDYPHWHFDEREDAWPVQTAPDLEAKIMGGNARAWYGL
jgi:predicted TIM-barrel fold metal-dependent hydrolase